jgi:3D (Asp-Asp-Asp) domain-containing protein
MDARTNIPARDWLIRLAIAIGLCACTAGMVIADRNADSFGQHDRSPAGVIAFLDDVPMDVDDREASATLLPVSTLLQLERAPVLMEVTAYCPCRKCCGPKAQGITASGKSVNYAGGRFVAADTSLLPFGTKVKVPGYNSDEPVEVIDRGGAIKGNKIDVFFASHDEAVKWGRRKIAVAVVD